MIVGDGEMDFDQRLAVVLRGRNVVANPGRRDMIRDAVERREAMVSAKGALATWTPSCALSRMMQSRTTT